MAKKKMGQGRLQGATRAGWNAKADVKHAIRCTGLIMGLVWAAVASQVQADAGAQLTALLETERAHYAGIALKSGTMPSLAIKRPGVVSCCKIPLRMKASK